MTGMRALLPLLALALGGCAVGPVRYTALGSDRFATIEFAKRVPLPTAPLAAVGGLVTDAGIAAADTVTFAILIPYAGVSYTAGYFSEANAPDRTTLQTVALPIIVPVMMIYMPVMSMISPRTLAESLGWKEGPYRMPGAEQRASASPRE